MLSGRRAGWHQGWRNRDDPGTGPVGLFAIQSTKVLGAERIIAVETVPERIAMAQKAGANTDFINFAEEDVYERLTLPDGRDITLYRATLGGHFKLHDGHIRAAKPDDGNTLRGQHDSKRDDTVSQPPAQRRGSCRQADRARR